jgi:hypothetical protein
MDKWAPVSRVLSGHYSPNLKWTNEVWGLTLCSDGETFITCSDDATVRKFSIK